MNKLFSLLFILLFSVAFTKNSDAQQILNQILERGEIRIGMSGDQPPFSMTATNGSMFGLDVDMATGLANQIGVKAKLVKMDFKNLISALERGDIDLIVSGLTMTIDRNKKVAFIGPYLISGNTIATKNKEYIDAEDINDIDMAGVKIAVMQGTTSEEFLNANISKATVFKSATNKLAMKLLMDGKVDIMVAGYPTIGIGVAPSDPLLINLVQNYLHALERTGILEQLKIKWFEEGSWVLDKEVKVQD